MDDRIFLMFDANDLDRPSQRTVAVSIPVERENDEDWVKAQFWNAYRTWHRVKERENG